MKRSLNHLLSARERRYQQQVQLIRRQQSPVLTLGLNAPGKNKTRQEYYQLWRKTKQLTKRFFGAKKVRVNQTRDLVDSAGYQYLSSIDLNPIKLKKLCLKLEKLIPYNRLVDLDVLNLKKRKVSRQDLNLSARQCFLCSNSAETCISHQTHKTQELASYFLREVKTWI